VGRRVAILLRTLAIVVLLAAVCFPLYWMAVGSFKTFGEHFARRPVFFPAKISFSVFRTVLVKDGLARYLANSAIVATGAMVFTLLLAVPAAYALARLRFGGSSAASGAFFAVYLFPAVVLMVPLYVLMAKLGLIDTRTGLIVSYLAQTLPVGVLMLANYFRSVPAQIEEAGMVDGLSRVGVIWRLVVPLSAPAIAVVAFYVFVIAWNEFLYAFMFLTEEGLFTLPIGLNHLQSSLHARWDRVMAAGSIMTFPVVLAFLAFEKHLVEGLASGGVKG